MSRAEDMIQGTLDKVPGYKGYRDKENRRDQDKAVRESVANALVANVDTLTRYNAQLANVRDFESLASLEPAVGQVRLLSDRIRHASYGYGGIFSEKSVDTNAIEQLRLFDGAMLRELESLTRSVGTLTSSTPPNADARSEMLAEIGRLSTLFDTRSSVVNNGRVSEDEEALQLLAIPEKVEPSPLLGLGKGDALSVLGDNYITNGIIKLKTDDGEIVLARVNAERSGATWLLGSSVPGMSSASLVEGEAGEGGFQTMSSATASIDTDQGMDDGIAARYAYRTLGDNRVELTLALGDTIRQYAGSTIVDKDIEVYGLA